MTKKERDRVECMLGNFDLLLSVVEHDMVHWSKKVNFCEQLKKLRATRASLHRVSPVERKKSGKKQK